MAGPDGNGVHARLARRVRQIGLGGLLSLIGGTGLVAPASASGPLNAVLPAAHRARAVSSSAPAVTMRWSFYYTPSYTTVLRLTVDGLSPGMAVIVRCQGDGCPPARRISAMTARQSCGQAPAPGCKWPATLSLTPLFLGQRLPVGAQIGVAIRSPGAVGKDYRFTVRARRGPRIKITYTPAG